MEIEPKSPKHSASTTLKVADKSSGSLTTVEKSSKQPFTSETIKVTDPGSTS